MSEIYQIIPFKIRFIVLICNLFLNVFILAPILMYNLKKFNQLTKDSRFMLLQKRHPQITKIACIACLIILLFERQIIVFLNCNFIDIFSQTFIRGMWRLERTIYPIISAVVWLGVWRCWHIFYDLKIAKALNDNTWKRYLNSELVKTNWYLNNRTKYNSYHYVQKIILIIWTISTIIQVTLFQLYMFDEKYHQLTRLVDSVLYLLPVLLCWIISCNAPSIEDRFYFKKETTYYSLILMGAILMYIIGILLQAKGLHPYYVQILLSVTASFAMFGVCMLQTHWVINKLKYDPVWRNKFNHQEELLNENEMKTLTLEKDKKLKDKTLKQFIASQQGFEHFIDHLQKEFSLELMLSVIELIQFKDLIKKRLTLTTDDDNPKRSYHIQIPENVPRSQTVYQLFEDEAPNIMATQTLQQRIEDIECIPNLVISNSTNKSSINLDEMGKFKTTAFLLYKKYIEEYSALEINISGPDRRKLTETLGNTQFIKTEIKPNQLYTLFDNAIEEMITLMEYSYTRFKYVQIDL